MVSGFPKTEHSQMKEMQDAKAQRARLREIHDEFCRCALDEPTPSLLRFKCGGEDSISPWEERQRIFLATSNPHPH